MSDMTTVFLILAVTIVLFVWGRLPSDLVALGSLLALYLTGLLSVAEAFAGFSNSTVVLVGALFVVGEGLTRTGVTAWAGERLIARARGSATRLLVVLMVGTAALSAFISNTVSSAARAVRPSGTKKSAAMARRPCNRLAIVRLLLVRDGVRFFI